MDISVIDLFGRLCPDGQPPLQVTGVTEATEDGVHFTPEGARALSEWLGPQLVTLTS